MPIYEYRCDDCGRLTSIFLRSINSKVEARCEHCDSEGLSRLMSAVNHVRTQQDVIDKFGAPGLGGRPEDAYRDPRQIGRWVEKRFEEYGMEVPEEMRGKLDAARDGELPEPIKDV